MKSQSVPQSSPRPSKQNTDQPSRDADTGPFGDYGATILGARSATDYESKPALIASYKSTNHSGENKMFMAAI